MEQEHYKHMLRNGIWRKIEEIDERKNRWKGGTRSLYFMAEDIKTMNVQTGCQELTDTAFDRAREFSPGFWAEVTHGYAQGFQKRGGVGDMADSLLAISKPIRPLRVTADPATIRSAVSQ
eukprot:scaffold117357_cov32-Prasinocladus_malaysianus.AAC.1